MIKLLLHGLLKQSDSKYFPRRLISAAVEYFVSELHNDLILAFKCWKAILAYQTSQQLGAVSVVEHVRLGQVCQHLKVLSGDSRITSRVHLMAKIIITVGDMLFQLLGRPLIVSSLEAQAEHGIKSTQWVYFF